MIFRREKCKPVRAPSEAQLSRHLSLTKSSYASLTADDGEYVQAAGGPGLFLLEYRNRSGAHFRAVQSSPVVPFPDGTLLSFSGGSIALAQGEWFQLRQVVAAFSSFASTAPFPDWLTWQKLTAGFLHAAQPALQADGHAPGQQFSRMGRAVA